VDSGKRTAPRGNKLEHIEDSTSGQWPWGQFGHRMRNSHAQSMAWDPSDKSVVDRKRIMEFDRRPRGRE
jgi:hypothetical protein